jgi:hypothetical protein
MEALAGAGGICVLMDVERQIRNALAAPNSYASIGLTYLLQGRFEEAAVAAQKDVADWARLLIVSCARWGQKRVPESMQRWSS